MHGTGVEINNIHNTLPDAAPLLQQGLLYKTFIQATICYSLSTYPASGQGKCSQYSDLPHPDGPGIESLWE
jgi:hypothetical protein